MSRMTPFGEAGDRLDMVGISVYCGEKRPQGPSRQ
jgi:hypothetical protein